jgi:dsDNA-specific endonuclease/ATPase MutS2
MTLYIEPEPLVELNNQLKQAEITIEQETLRILRNLSRAAGCVADEVEANVATLEALDLAFARAGLAEELDAAPTHLEEVSVKNAAASMSPEWLRSWRSWIQPWSLALTSLCAPEH